jgi:hypothetical protein
MQQAQAQPVQPVMNPADQLLAQYPEWDEQKKGAFIGTVKDPEFLKRILKREPSQGLITYITSRISELEAAHAAALAAQAQQGAAPPEVLQNAVEDRSLVPPPPPQFPPQQPAQPVQPVQHAQVPQVVMPVAQPAPAPAPAPRPVAPQQPQQVIFQPPAQGVQGVQG